MMKELEQEYANLLYFDKPIPYKNLEIYPLTVENYFLFHNFVSCFFLEKKQQMEYINMSYLKFLIEEFTQNNTIPIYHLVLLLELCLKKKFTKQQGNNILFDNFEFGYKESKPYFKIGDFFYNNSDLEQIKNIICLQQGLVNEEEQIDSELKNFLEKSLKLQQIKNFGDLEDLIVCVTISTNYKLEDIYKLPIRKFNKILERIDKKMNYQIMKTAEMSGMVKFNQEIEDWRADTDYRSRYDSVLMKKEDFNNKFNNNKN